MSKRDPRPAAVCLVIVLTALVAVADSGEDPVLKLQEIALTRSSFAAEELALRLARRGDTKLREPLSALIRHKDRGVRLFGAVALTSLDRKLAVKELAAQLAQDGRDGTGNSDVLRRMAIRQVSALKVEEMLPELAALILDMPEGQDAGLRSESAEAIRKIGAGPIKQKLLPVVLRRGPTPIGLFAAIALWDVEREAAVLALRKMWGERASGPPRFGDDVQHQLDLLESEEFLDIYRKMAREGWIPLAIATLKAKAAVPDVLAALDRPEPMTKATALLTLDAIGDESGLRAARTQLAAKPLASTVAAELRRDLALLSEPRQRGIPAPKGSAERWIKLLEPRSAAAMSAERLGAAKDACEHWGGEEPYDDARAKDIAAGYRSDCGDAVRVAIAELKRSPKSAEVRQLAQELLNSLAGEVDSSALEDALRE